MAKPKYLTLSSPNLPGLIATGLTERIGEVVQVTINHIADEYEKQPEGAAFVLMVRASREEDIQMQLQFDPTYMYDRTN